MIFKRQRKKTFIALASGTTEYDEAVVNALAELMASASIEPDAFYDVLELPYPKEHILTAVENEMLRESSEQRLEWLLIGLTLLPQFQMGVGFKPCYLLGVSAQKLPQELSVAKKLFDDLAPEMERAKSFADLGEREAELIKARTDAVLALRKARIDHKRVAETQSRFGRN